MSRFPGVTFSVQISPNKTVGNWRKDVIVLHWWDDPARRPSFNGVVTWFMNRSARVSAQYTVEGGRICQQVLEKDMAWHAGNAWANRHGIGIEVNPRLSAADYETTAQLVAEIWSRRGKLPVRRHRDYRQTSCPGTMDVNRIIRRAEQIRAGSSTARPPSGGSSGGSSGSSGGTSTSNAATYTVRRGDTLGAIARTHSTSVPALQFLNGISNPNRITPGQRLFTRFTVGRGHTLGQIADLYNRSAHTRTRTSAAALARLNSISNPNNIRAGQRLRLP